MAADLCRSGSPSGPYKSPAARHAWVNSERAHLCMDTAVGNWADKPLLFHLKACPERFLPMDCDPSSDLASQTMQRRHASPPTPVTLAHPQQLLRMQSGARRRIAMLRTLSSFSLRALSIYERQVSIAATSSTLPSRRTACVRVCRCKRRQRCTSTPTGRGVLTEMPKRGIWQVGTHTDRRRPDTSVAEDCESHKRALSLCDRRSIS